MTPATQRAFGWLLTAISILLAAMDLSDWYLGEQEAGSATTWITAGAGIFSGVCMLIEARRKAKEGRPDNER